jgi:hypothetical protein
MTNAKMDWYGTFRGRLGWTAGPVLFYGTGGVAYGNVELNSTVSNGQTSLGAQAWSARVGWVAGGGIEYMARPDVIFSVNYQYVDFGHVSLASSEPAFGTPISLSASAHMQFQAVTAGVSWLFPPGDKGPHGAWEGMYVGGHAGGAWGDRTSANYSVPVPALSDARLKRDIVLVGRPARRRAWAIQLSLPVERHDLCRRHGARGCSDPSRRYRSRRIGRLSAGRLQPPWLESDDVAGVGRPGQRRATLIFSIAAGRRQSFDLSAVDFVSCCV